MKLLLNSLSEALCVRFQVRNDDVVQRAVAVTYKWRASDRVPSMYELAPITKLFADEALARAELIDARLQQTRQSWSPRQIVDDQAALRQGAHDILTSTLGQMGNAIEQAAGITALRQARAICGPDFDAGISKAARGALQIVDACVTEIITAAKTDLEALTMAERPTYQNTFHGNVGAVAQGGSSVGAVHQTNKGLSPEEIARAVELILGALHQYTGNDEKVLAAIADLRASLEAAQNKRVPFARLIRAVQFLAGSEQLIAHAPAAVDALHHLVSAIS